MKKYILRALIFGSPIVICFLIVLVVDPYNFFNLFHVISDKDKFAVVQRTDESSPRGNILWKTIKFRRNPTKTVIIGDSQGKDIRTDLIQQLTGEEVSNLCFPGASFQTMFETFWFAAGEAELKKVYFQVAFMNYNNAREYDLFHFASNYFKRPYEYFTTKEIYFDSFVNIAYAITHEPWLVERSYEFLSDSDMEKLVQFRLDLFFKKYIYPEDLKIDFLKIIQYCRENEIEVNFIIFPVYEGVDKHLQEIGLTNMKNRFKSDISSYGNTYDLDTLTEIKSRRENFFDYFHPRQVIIDSLTRMVWKKKEESIL